MRILRRLTQNQNPLERRVIPNWMSSITAGQGATSWKWRCDRGLPWMAPGIPPAETAFSEAPNIAGGGPLVLLHNEGAQGTG